MVQANRSSGHATLARFILLLLIAAYTLFCASVTMAPEAEDAAAKRFEAPPGKALIYAVRPSQFTGSAINLLLMIDGEIGGALDSGSYAVLEVEPGAHTIGAASSLAGEGFQVLKVQVQAGGLYFVKITPKMGLAATRVSVEELDAKEGRRLVLRYKLVQTL